MYFKFSIQYQISSSFFSLENEFLDWCPYCNDPLLCKNKFLFIAGTGRSGSTSILNMVNAIPGIYLGGEISNITHIIKMIYDSLLQIRKHETTKEKYVSINPWEHQTVNTSKLYEAVQEFIMILNPPPPSVAKETKIRGFKEVHWTKEEVLLIEKIFPCSRIILNYRENHRKQKQSGFFSRKFKYTAKKIINQRENGLIEGLMEVNIPFYNLPLEEFSVEKFNQLVKWLGVKCKFDKVTHANDGNYLPGEDVRCIKYESIE